MAFCVVHGHRIHYQILHEEKRGPGIPMLVFLHEGLGSIAQWKDFPTEIAEKTNLPALVYDRYGHGKSDILQKKRTGEFMWNEGSNELPAILQALHINEELILIGHSDGGTIALAYASQFPSKVKIVITEAAHVFLEEISRSGIRNAVCLFQTRKLRQFLIRYHGERTDSMFYGWADTWLSDEMNNWDMKDQLTKISCPVLAIQGINDEYGSPEQVYRIIKYCSGPAESFIVDNCAHIPHFQQRERVTEKMITLIKLHL